MRLSNHEQDAIISILSIYVKGKAKLLLFGSRIDDTAKGGDIDLLLITEDECNRKELAFNKFEMLAKIKSQIGEQKIDLLIATPESIDSSAFLQSILQNTVCLKKW